MALLDYVDDPDGGPLVQMLKNNPRVQDLRLGKYDELMYEGDLDPAIKQLAYLTVSWTNRTEYCTLSHSTILVERCDAPETVARAVVEGEFDRLDNRERAVVDLARQIATDPKGVDEEHVAALREAGFDDADVVELVAVAADALDANAFVDALGLRHDEVSIDRSEYVIDPFEERRAGNGE